MTIHNQLPQIQGALKNAGLDGWLLFDFRGLNPIAQDLLGINGMVTRRYFCYIPATGEPVAITHAIEQGPWRNWPAEWTKKVYSDWRVLTEELKAVVSGKKVAMEYYPEDAVPYLDRIPAGVVEMVRAAGATVMTSGDLVSEFYAVWTSAQYESHTRAAERIAAIAHEAFKIAGERASAGTPIGEYELAQHILSEFEKSGLSTDHGPNVSIGRNAANPHYEPSANRSATIEQGQILLIDLWAREKDGVYADQTWMGSLGTPGDRDIKIWEAIRDAREAATELLRSRISSGQEVRGFEPDDASRNVIVERGFGKYFIHRTGHSIDSRELHGSGPHLDNLETNEQRLLIPGVGFSIEPGIYIEGDVGMRTEVNGFIGEGELIITPSKPQVDLIVV